MKKKNGPICSPYYCTISYRLFFLAAVSTLLLIVSCGPVGKYTPDPGLAKGAVQGIALSHPVAVLNDQAKTKSHTLPVRDIVVDYASFTQSLVEALKQELTRNGVSVQESASKRLYIAVTHVKMPPPVFYFAAHIYVRVKTGDGQVEKLKVTKSSYASQFNIDLAPTRPLDAAFKDMVRKILTNPEILEYLAQAEGDS